MLRFRRIVPLLAVIAMTTVVTPRHAGAQQPPPDNGGGGGGFGGGGFGGGGGPPGDNGGGPPGMGGPPNQAQMAERMVRTLKRQLNADGGTFDSMLPDIQKIVQLQQALTSNARPDRGGGGGPGGGGPGGGGPGGGGPPDMNGGGGPGGDQNGGGGGGGGGGNDQNANADQANGGGGGGDTTTRRRRRRNNQDDNAGQQQNGNGGDQAANPMPEDATATALAEKVRALREGLRPNDDGGNGDADVSSQVAEVRAARTKALAELAALRKDLKSLVKTPHQEAVFVANGILE